METNINEINTFGGKIKGILRKGGGLILYFNPAVSNQRREMIPVLIFYFPILSVEPQMLWCCWTSCDRVYMQQLFVTRMETFVYYTLCSGTSTSMWSRMWHFINMHIFHQDIPFLGQFIRTAHQAECVFENGHHGPFWKNTFLSVLLRHFLELLDTAGV